MKQHCKKKEEEIFLLAHFLSSLAFFNFLFLYIDSEHYDAKTYTPCIAERRSEYREAILPCINSLDGGRKGSEDKKKKKTQVLQKRTGRADRKDLERNPVTLCEAF